jgi:hypothetical protein
MIGPALVLSAAVIGVNTNGLAGSSCLRGETSAQALAVTPRTIEKGDQSNVEDSRQVVVRTDAEWTRLWQQHSPDRPKPAVDFSKETIVGVFMGSRPNAGFSTAIISATEGGGALIVRYAESTPAPGLLSAQVLTFPYHIVAIPKATAANVTFEKAQ